MIFHRFFISFILAIPLKERYAARCHTIEIYIFSWWNISILSNKNKIIEFKSFMRYFSFFFKCVTFIGLNENFKTPTPQMPTRFNFSQIHISYLLLSVICNKSNPFFCVFDFYRSIDRSNRVKRKDTMLMHSYCVYWDV